jgi:uncharacterized RDD family membrane protein YckC
LDGASLTHRQVLVRNAARVIDILPGFYIVGLIAIRASPARPQRLGDRLAETTVGKTR